MAGKINGDVHTGQKDAHRGIPKGKGEEPSGKGDIMSQYGITPFCTKDKGYSEGDLKTRLT